MIDQGSVFASGGPGNAGGFGGPPPAGGFGAPPPGGFGAPPPGGFGGGLPPGPLGAPPPPPGWTSGMGPLGGPSQPSQGLAIGALVTGILALPGACCCYSSVPLGICAVVMGALAMNKAKLSPLTYGGRSMAMAGLVCGAIGLALTAAMVLLGAGMSVLDWLTHHVAK